MSALSGIPSRGGLSPHALDHRARRRRVCAEHPQVRALQGRNPATALAIPALLSLHWGLAWAVHDTSLWVVLLTAFVAGQLVLHAAGSLVHEAAHRLVFRGALLRHLFDLQLELILTSFGHHLRYQHDHVSSHHPYLGDYERDYEFHDACGFHARRSLREARPTLNRALVALQLGLELVPLGFLLTDWLMPRLVRRLSGRTTHDPLRRVPGTRPTRTQLLAAACVSLGVWIGLFLLLGPLGLLYQVWSLSLFQGLWAITNLGQVRSEHAGDDHERPTRSSYGPLNWLLFNTGYHDEHHTFPNVPWSRLPRLRALAPDVFSAANPRSYLGLWWEHLRVGFPARRMSPLHEDAAGRCAPRAG